MIDASWGRGLLNFVQLQAGWFACVLGAAHGQPWLGPAVVTGLVVLHLLSSSLPGRDLLMILALGLVGTALDSAQGALGLLTFRGAMASWIAPAWITALWLHFGTALPPLAGLLRGRPLLAMALGAVAGPLAYSGGARLGAAELHPLFWPSLLSTGLVWAAVLPLAVRLFGSFHETAQRDA